MALSGRGRSAAVARGGPSLTRDTTLELQDVPATGFDLENTCLVWGTAATVPATYGALSNAHHLQLSSLNAVHYDGANTLYKLLSASGLGITGSVDDHLWVGFVGSIAIPISGTTLDSVVDVGALIA